ncbi:MAG: quercetin 2,3-dioxygenase [Acidobacteria bacterium]|nr:MAG: quercetin 2,3-dioxygenase [Acidobacteriota bacterium]
MLQVIRSNQRGHANHGWLNTYHTFSFADYYNPDMMGFRSLRVINEDRVTAGQGFGTHGHADMEILSYVVEGAIAHKDSTGGEEILRPHEWQRMTAGSGIRHSEYNPSKTENLHFYQIWILPEKEDLEAGYEQKMFAPNEKSGKLKLVASKDARDGSLKINQDVSVFDSILNEGEEVSYDLTEKRYGFLQVVKGSLELNGETLRASDGAAISTEKLLKIKALGKGTEFILFDLA